MSEWGQANGSLFFCFVFFSFSFFDEKMCVSIGELKRRKKKKVRGCRNRERRMKDAIGKEDGGGVNF